MASAEWTATAHPIIRTPAGLASKAEAIGRLLDLADRTQIEAELEDRSNRLGLSLDDRESCSRTARTVSGSARHSDVLESDRDCGNAEASRLAAIRGVDS